MSFKKIERRDMFKPVNLAQVSEYETLNYDRGIPSSPDSEPAEQEVQLSEEELSKLISQFMNSNIENTSYDPSTDSEDYVSSGKIISNMDEVRALKSSNRLRALEQEREIASLKSSYRSILNSDDTRVEYDKDRNVEFHGLMFSIFGPEAADGFISTGQYAGLLELEAAIVESDSGVIVSGVETRRSPAGALDLSVFGGKEDVQVDQYSHSVVVQGINLWRDRRSQTGRAGITAGQALALNYDSVIEAEQINRSVISTLSGIDENTSYVDSLFGRPGTAIHRSGIGDRPKSYELKDILEGCFDCFLEGWNGNVDFKLNLDVEIRLRELIATLNDLLKAIKYSIDIPGIILSNTCSLQRLGVLCPIEIAFLLASLYALLRFFITEVVLDFKGFTFQLLSALLLPLLNMLQVTSNFAIAPFSIYAGCTMKSLLGASEAEWTGRLTRKMIHDILNFKEREIEEAGIPPETVERVREEFTPGDMIQGSPKARAFADYLLNPEPVTNSSAFNTLGVPWLAKNIDPLEYFSGLLIESNQKLTNAHTLITQGIQSIRLFINRNSVARTELVAKIIALSTFIGVVGAIYNLLDGRTAVCSEETDEDGNVTLEPNFTPSEFLEILGLPSFLDVRSNIELDISNRDIINGEGVNPSPGAEPPFGSESKVLINNMTGSRFTLTNCSKGKTRNVSSIELQSILKSAGLR